MDEWFDEFDGVGDAGADAFNVLSSLYQLFGLDQSAIPFVTDGRVDPEKIRAVTG